MRALPLLSPFMMHIGKEIKVNIKVLFSLTPSAAAKRSLTCVDCHYITAHTLAILSLHFSHPFPTTLIILMLSQNTRLVFLAISLIISVY